MTQSEHVYAAYLIGTPDVELAIRGGSISLDAGQAPHVQADIEVSDISLASDLDPRDNARVRIEVTATLPSGTQERSFDLGIRSRAVDHNQGVVRLSLASDEALLSDWADVSTDIYPYALQESVRDLTDYVLNKAIPGAALAVGGPDAPIRALIESVNLVRNPRARFDLGDWSSAQSIARISSGGPDGAPTYVNVQSATDETLMAEYSADGVPIEEGKHYRVIVWQNAEPGTVTAVDAVVLDELDAILLDVLESPATIGGGWERRSFTFVAPATAVKVKLRSFTTSTVTAGDSLNTSAWRVSEITDDETDNQYFDGDTTDTSEYLYAYEDETSTRTPLIDRASDLLTWRGGVSGIAFLAPILQSLGLRLVCDENREWTLRDEGFIADGAVSIRHAVNMISASDEVSRDSGWWFDAAVTNYKWIDLAGAPQSRQDGYYLTFPYTLLKTFEKATPYPGPGFSEYAVRRAQERGREVSASVVSDWRANAEQQIAIVLDDAPTQYGTIQQVTFDLDTDRMTVTTRTTDTPLGAIDLLEGAIDDLTGSIDDL